MECDKCHSTNIEIAREEKGLIIDSITFEQYEITTIYMKCNSCGNEFTESV